MAVNFGGYGERPSLDDRSSAVLLFSLLFSMPTISSPFSSQPNVPDQLQHWLPVSISSAT